MSLLANFFSLVRVLRDLKDNKLKYSIINKTKVNKVLKNKKQKA